MYAVLFDLGVNCLNENNEGNTYYNVYKLIKEEHRCRTQRGSR